MPEQVTVIGAGVIGLSCSYKLAKAGYQVTVYHHQPLSETASGNAAGALKPFDALQTGWKQKLQQQSLWQYPDFLAEVEAESGIETGFKRCGRVAVFDRATNLEKATKAAHQANKAWPFSPAQTVLSHKDLLAYTPDVEPDACGGIFCHVTALFTPQKLLEALINCCEKRGVAFVQKELTALPDERPLIVAAGAYTQKLLPEVPMKPIKRQAILLEWPFEEPLQHIVENGQVYLVPWPREGRIEGRRGRAVYVGSTFEPEAGFDNTMTDDAEEQLRADAARLFPELKTAKLLKRFSGLQSRGCGEGSTLKLGSVDGKDGVFVAAGHGGVGFCMAPITADEILTHLNA